LRTQHSVQNGEPISKLLQQQIDEEDARRIHPIEEYADAFENSGLRARKVMHVGGDSVVLELADGNVMKMTGKRYLVGEMGKRPFDLPILRQGMQPNPAGHDICWLIQPMARTPSAGSEASLPRQPPLSTTLYGAVAALPRSFE
jgi:hypothetical protein